MATHTNLSGLMIELPAGSIVLRDDRTKQQWTVDIASFLLAKFPVTQALYAEIMDETPSTFIGEQLPVETVSWKDAVTFCNALSAKKKLPSILKQTDTAFQPKPNGNMLVKQEQLTFDTENWMP
jgi:formylglycine-generating enzyme required for sulfatase activity